MAEGQRGRPKKHLTDEHHFKSEEQETASVAENPIVPIVEQDIQPISTSLTDTLIDNASGVTLYGLALEESPIEQKIHELVEANGWKAIDSNFVSELPPRNGMPIRISREPKGEGLLAQWKKTRAFANPTKRWVETGIWIDFMSGLKVNFEPKYWKERFGV